MSNKTRAMKLIAVLGIASLMFLVGCGGTTGQSINQPPAVVTVSPASATVQTGGVQQFTATVSPSGANQAVIWSLSGTGCTGASCGTIDTTGKYTAPATTPNPPTVTVRAASVADSAKAAVAAVNVMTAVNPIPAITTISPNSADTGGAPFTLTVNGSNFVAGSVVRWNDSDRPTAFISASQVSAQIPASDIAVAGTAAITVFNPAPGGGASNSLTFTITGPTITTISPNSADTGGAAFTLTVNGRNFVTGSVVNFAGVARATTFVKPSQLTAAIPAAAITTARIAAVTVTNPAPSGGASNPVNFTIGRFLPRFAYVANAGSNDVSMYTINATTGALTAIAPTVTGGGSANSVAVDPSGRFAYVAGADNDFGFFSFVSMFTINATTGVLTSIGAIDAGITPASVPVDPSGRFAYAASLNSTDVSMYTIDVTTGALTAIAPGAIAAGSNPRSVAVDPSGRFAYVANGGSNSVSMYTIDVTTGTLTSIGTIAAGTTPFS